MKTPAPARRAGTSPTKSDNPAPRDRASRRSLRISRHASRRSGAARRAKPWNAAGRADVAHRGPPPPEARGPRRRSRMRPHAVPGGRYGSAQSLVLSRHGRTNEHSSWGTARRGRRGPHSRCGDRAVAGCGISDTGAAHALRTGDGLAHAAVARDACAVRHHTGRRPARPRVLCELVASRAVQAFVGHCAPRSRTLGCARCGARARLALNRRLGDLQAGGRSSAEARRAWLVVACAPRLRASKPARCGARFRSPGRSPHCRPASRTPGRDRKPGLRSPSPRDQPGREGPVS